MADGDQADDKTIPDDAVIWRRVTPDQAKTTDDGLIPTPSAFRDSSDSPMSAILAADSSTERALGACPDNGVVGITAGASAPEELVQELITRLGDFGEVALTNMEGVEENITFKLPSELKDAVRTQDHA